MPNFRKGLDAIEKASNSGDFKGGKFAPQISWRDDKEEKYIILLTPIDETVTIDLHEWVPVGEGERSDGTKYTSYEQFISRTDPAIGEDYDDLTERLDRKARPKTLGVAVELEPVMETVKGRQKPKSFVVKTDTINVNDDEVEIPSVGILCQAAKNFWGWLGSFDGSQAPITETPFQVIRRGKDKDTAYDFMPMMDMEVDYENLIENAGNLLYLDEEEIGEIVENADSIEEAAESIGLHMLFTRLEELADGDRYEELVSPIEEIEDKFGGKSKTNTKPKNTSKKRVTKQKQEPEDTDEEEKPKKGKGSKTSFADLKKRVEAKKNSE